MVPDSKICLILVDDDKDQLEIMKLYLGGLDKSLSITITFSADEALRLIRTQEYDCVVCDYLMPGKNGLDLCAELRRLGYNVPFILFTARGSEEVAERAFEVGVDQYLRKVPDPSVYNVLYSHILRLVSRSK